MTQRIEVHSLERLTDVAKAILEARGDRNIIVFRGEMGGGKTTLITRIVAQAGSMDRVTSPTFAIINEYVGASKEPIYHFDFYRIDSLREAYDFGYEEYFYSGNLCLVEWPEKVEALLPDNVMEVKIEVVASTGRVFTFE